VAVLCRTPPHFWAPRVFHFSTTCPAARFTVVFVGAG